MAWINARKNVVLPAPCSPATTMDLPACTASSRNRATSTGIIPRWDRSPRLIWVSKCWRMTTDGCNDTSEEIAWIRNFCWCMIVTSV